MQETKRQNGIDVARGIAILLVVLGHLTAPLSFWNDLAFSVHMPLFFVLSGYLVRPEKYDFWTFVRRRAERLLIPYFVFRIYRGIVEGFSLLDVIPSVLYCSGKASLVLPLFDQPWFLCCLFVAEVLFYLIVKSKSLAFPLVLLFSIGGFLLMNFPYLPWSIDIALFVQFYLFLGYAFKKLDVFRSLSLVYQAILGAIALMIWLLILWYASSNGQNVVTVISLNERHVPLFSIFVSIVGVVGILFLSELVGRVKYMSFPLVYMGRISLVIYFYHLIVPFWQVILYAELFRILPLFNAIYALPPWWWEEKIFYRIKKKFLLWKLKRNQAKEKANR